MELKGFLNLPFGCDKEAVIKEIEENRKGRHYENEDTEDRMYFSRFYIANRKVDNSCFYFIDNKFCRVRITFDYNNNIYPALELYNMIKEEISNKYYVSDNDYVKYTPPAYEDDDFDTMHENSVRKGLIEYACYWNFPSEYDEDNYIILRMMSDLSIQINYEHGHLNGKYIKSKQLEW